MGAQRASRGAGTRGTRREGVAHGARGGVDGQG